jgi:hypothetical protein
LVFLVCNAREALPGGMAFLLTIYSLHEKGLLTCIIRAKINKALLKVKIDNTKRASIHNDDLTNITV